MLWNPTTPDFDCRFKIVQIPNKPGFFHVEGASAQERLMTVKYNENWDLFLTAPPQGGMLGDDVFRLVSLGGDDIYLVADALGPRPLIFLSNSEFDLADLFAGLVFLKSTTYGNDKNKITIEPAAIKTEVYDVQYNINDKEIIGLNPTIAAQKILENKNNSNASQSVSYSYTKCDEGNWNNKFGIELGQTFRFTASVPFISSLETEISFKESYEHSWGGSTATSQSITTATTVDVPAHTTIKVTVMIHNSRINIPFTYTERTTLYDGTIREVKNKEGIYRNVEFINDHTTTETIS